MQGDGMLSVSPSFPFPGCGRQADGCFTVDFREGNVRLRKHAG